MCGNAHRLPSAEIIKGNGELLPVSKMPCDGVFPTATTKYEKRDLALNIPSWNPDACVQLSSETLERLANRISLRNRLVFKLKTNEEFLHSSLLY